MGDADGQAAQAGEAVEAGGTATVQVELWLSPGPRQVEFERLRLPAGSTVAQALQASALCRQWAELCADPGSRWSLWGRAVSMEMVLREGDRLALCRPLQVDPKEARRLRFRSEGLRRHPPRPRVRRCSTGAAPANEPPSA